MPNYIQISPDYRVFCPIICYCTSISRLLRLPSSVPLFVIISAVQVSLGVKTMSNQELFTVLALHSSFFKAASILFFGFIAELLVHKAFSISHSELKRSAV